MRTQSMSRRRTVSFTYKDVAKKLPKRGCFQHDFSAMDACYQCLFSTYAIKERIGLLTLQPHFASHI